MTGSLVSRYFMNNSDILTTRANAQHISRSIAAICTWILAVIFFYTMGFIRDVQGLLDGKRKMNTHYNLQFHGTGGGFALLKAVAN